MTDRSEVTAVRVQCRSREIGTRKTPNVAFTTGALLTSVASVQPSAVRRAVMARFSREWYPADVIAQTLPRRRVQDHAPSDVAARYPMTPPELIADSRRILHCPPLDRLEEENAVRASAHQDINPLTILPSIARRDLEVIGSEGVWIAVPADTGCIVVNRGDMRRDASGGTFRSTIRRVVDPGGEHRNVARISVPIFARLRAEIADPLVAIRGNP